MYQSIVARGREGNSKRMVVVVGAGLALGKSQENVTPRCEGS